MVEMTEMFSDYSAKIRRLSKDEYKQLSEDFADRYAGYFRELLDQIDTVDDKESMAVIEGRNFAGEVYRAFEKNGKLKKTRSLDLSIYMIYFVFPCILGTKHANAVILCDKLRDEWNAKFGQNINYADYETIRDGFKNKLFGIL